MKPFLKLLLLILLFLLLVLFQSNRFFEIGGIAPNLILVGFLILSLSLPEKENFKFVLPVGFVLVLASLLWFPFWIWEMILVFIFGLILGFFKNILFGDIFLDFFISAVAFTVLFYALSCLFGAGFFLWPAVLGELLYNMVLGELALLVVSRFV